MFDGDLSLLKKSDILFAFYIQNIVRPWNPLSRQHTLASTSKIDILASYVAQSTQHLLHLNCAYLTDWKSISFHKIYVKFLSIYLQLLLLREK